MFTVFKRPGRRAQVRFMPGCLIWSLLLSVGLTILTVGYMVSRGFAKSGSREAYTADDRS